MKINNPQIPVYFQKLTTELETKGQYSQNLLMFYFVIGKCGNTECYSPLNVQ